MAGTLTVQNIQGPTSGDNANKIIVPSGHTLDASAGIITPSVDQIIQVKNFDSGSSSIRISAITFSDVFTFTFTQKEAGSRIIAIAAAPIYTFMTAGAWTGAVYIHLVRGSTIIAGAEHPGPKNTVGEFSASPALQSNEIVSTAGDHTYKVQARMVSSGGYADFGRTTAGADSRTRITVMEIAQ